MHKWEALAMMTVWEVRGPPHSSRQRATAFSMVTGSKERPSSSTLSMRFIDASSGSSSWVAGMPQAGALGVDPGGGCPLAQAQAGMLIGAEEAPELEIVVAREALEPASEIAPQHGRAANRYRVSGQAVDRHGQVVERRGSHEVLPEPGPKSPGPDALLARALRAQVDEADGLEIDALCNPAEHAGFVAIDAVPHDLAYKAPDLFETGDPVELSHAYRHLVPAHLRRQHAALRVDKPRLTGGCADARIA